jgi:SAM-dependent methyltransferase
MGLDVDPLAAETARRVSGCPVYVGTLQSAPFPADHFQLIYMSHVLEHLPDIAASLTRCHELLAAGGRLVLVYPNPQSLIMRRYGKFSINWDPPRHLVLPSVLGLVGLLKRIGFDVLKAETSHTAAAGLRAVARGHRAGRGWRAPQIGDHLFALWERLLVSSGAAVGEEVIVVARRAR